MLNNQLIGQDKFIKVLPNTRKYLVEDFIDFSNTFIFGAKTPEEVIIEEIKKDYYSFEEYEGINYVRFAEGFPIETYDRIKVLKAEDMVSVPVHFTTVSSITPDSLNRNFDTLGEITRVIQEIFNNRALRIDAPDGEVLLPKLESGYFWVKTDVGYKAESLETYASKIEDYTTSQLNAISSAIGVLQTGYIKLIEDGKKEGDRHLLSFLETFKMFVEEQKKSIASSATGIKNELDVHATEKKKEMSDLTLALNSSLIKEGEKQKDGITTHSVEVLKSFNKSADEKTAEEIGKIETALENEISENGLNARQENVEERQADVEWRMSRLEVFRLGDTPSPSKLKSVIGVKDGRFGYWDRDKEIPVNADFKPLNWFDNGVFSDLPKPVTLNNGTMHLDIDYDEYIEPADEIAENDSYRVVKSTKGHIELTRYHTEIVEGEEVRTSETRYHEWVYYSADEVLINFGELWSNSWLWEECEQRGDYEVVINRKHNEIVIGKIVDKVAYTDENGTEFFNPVWEHKYLPLYPLTIDEIFTEAERMFEIEPYVMNARVVPTGDYEIAGQALKERLDLGVGYENLAITSTKGSGVDYTITHLENGHIRYDFNGIVTNNGLIWLATYHSVNEGESTTYSFECLECSEELLGIDVSLRNSLTSNNKLKVGEIVGIGVSSSFPRLLYKPSEGLDLTGKYFIIKNLQITKTSTPKPFIKNSRPDSKLALPQLATLGEVTSISMHGNHLVAQHENGTAIIKNAVINPNAPLSSLHWGLQAYKDENGNKRLFCSTADGTYPVGWENIKYDAEEGGNVVFYDVARNSSSNNIAGLITSDMKVYIGEGYENLFKLNDVGIANNGVITTTKNNTGITFVWNGGDGINSFNVAWINDINVSKDDKLRMTIVSNVEQTIFRYLAITYTSTDGSRKTLILNYTSEITIPSDFDRDLSINIRAQDAQLTAGYAETLSKLQLTKTSTPKPFTAGIVPNGSLKVACDWTSENKSFVFKNIYSNSKEPISVLPYFANNKGSGGGGGEYISVHNTHTYRLNNIVVSNNKATIISDNGVKGDMSFVKKGISEGTLTFSRDGYSYGGTEYCSQILIYNNPNLTQAQMEGELAKDIYLPTYHHQPNSIINAYGITALGAMYLFQPALTSAEVDAELGKDIYLPKTQWDIPDYLGNS